MQIPVWKMALIAAALLLVSGTATAGNGDALMPHVPSSARMVAGIDVASLRGTAVLDQVLQAANAQQRIEQVTGRLDRVGFNPTQQLDSLVVVGITLSRDERPLLLLEGDLPRAAIEQALATEGQARSESVGGFTIYTRSSSGSIVFLTDRVAAMGPPRVVQQVATQASSGEASRLSRGMRTLMGQANRSQSLWFIATPTAAQLESTPFRGATGVRGHADLRSGLRLTTHAVMPSAAAASTTASSMQDQISTAASRDEVAALGLGPVIQSIQANARGEAVELTIQLDQARFRRTLNTVVAVIRDQLR